MQLTMNQVAGLHDFYQEIKDKTLPIRVSYNLSKLGVSLEKEMSFYTKKMQEIISACGETDEEGNYVFTDETRTSIKLKKDKSEEFREKISELRALTVEVEIPNFSIDDFDGLSLSPDKLIPLLAIISE